MMIAKPPIFVIGSPRSGTTLLRLILNNHRNIVVPPECGFAIWHYQKYRGWDASSSPSLIDSFMSDLMSSRKIETWNLDATALKARLVESNPISYAEVVSTVYEFYGFSLGRSFERWGDKNNFYIHRIAEIRELFPDALFVHIIRDGRDVACSYRKLGTLNSTSAYAPKLPTDIVEIAREWSANIQDAVNAFETFAWDNVYEIKYENLVANPADEARKLCDFLGEQFDESMLHYYQHNKDEEQEPKEFLAWKQKTLEAPTTSEVGKFRSELSEDEIAKFEVVARPVLQRYGYI